MMDVITLTLEGMAYGGEAFGREQEGRMVFVPFGLPDEVVRVELVDVHKRWARARMLEVLEPSPVRIDPRCRHFGICGGCHYQQLPYEEQLKVKRDVLRSQLERIGKFEDPPVAPTVPSPSPWEARNHLQFSLSAEGELGFMETGSNQVVAIQECFLPEPALGDLWPRFTAESEPPFSRVGMRVGDEGQAMIVLHSQEDPLIEMEIDLPASIVWLGPGGAAVLAGEGFLVQSINGRPFQVSAGSFFQVNSLLAGSLVDQALTSLDVQPGQKVLDLYAGVGLFSAFIAQAGADLIAVESSPWACSDFEINLEEFDQVALYQASVEQALPLLEIEPHAVLLDPPRGGVEREALERLIEMAPSRIVYVSCDPATLARDGRILAEGGYRLEQVTPYDMFPQTYHIESISKWIR
ncbi:MAG: class I SAM-dependent RNA methyltransferase [Anaerolineales bacterium]|jgi:23S rRNA (uracil1939-C5)-methyltransferase